MGSLILLLLVLDRRAKIVALRKAQAEHKQILLDEDRYEREFRRKTAEEEKQAAWQNAEFERRRQQLHQMLLEEEQDLAGKIENARGQIAATKVKVDEAQANTKRLRAEIQLAGLRLATSRQATQAEEDAAASATQLTEQAKHELERQTQDLLQMEQALANLKALRERQKNTYSLVPYLGRRGEGRRPLYVECAAVSLVFHPEAFSLDGPLLTPGRIRDEVQNRIANRAQQLVSNTAEQQRPYVLMLVRPDGIATYYATMQALSGLKVDFGYEFIESDWVMDFSADAGNGLAQPWMTTSRIPSQLPPPSPTTVKAVLSKPNFSATGFDAMGRGSSAMASGSGVIGGGRLGSVFGSRSADQSGGSLLAPFGSEETANASDNPARAVRLGAPYWGAGSSSSSGGSGAGISNGWQLALEQNYSANAQLGSMPDGLPWLPWTNPTATDAGGSGGHPGGSINRGVPATGSQNASAAGGRGAGPATGEGNNSTGGWRAESGAGNGGVGGPPATSGMSTGQPGVQNANQNGSQANGTLEPRSTQVAGGGTGVQGSGPAASGEPGAGTESSGICEDSAPRSPGPEGGAGGGNSHGGGVGRGGANDAGGLGGSGVTVSISSSPGPMANSARSSPPPQSPDGDAGGSSQGGGGSSWSAMPSPSAGGATASSKVSPLLGRMLGNRDWILYVECHTDGVILKFGNQKFSMQELSSRNAGDNPLVRAVRQVVARRQSTVAEGEPPYRPILRFQVWPDGLASYYLAYPLLQSLQLPMARENVDPRKDGR
jgi:hypothetical protein